MLRFLGESIHTFTHDMSPEFLQCVYSAPRKASLKFCHRLNLHIFWNGKNPSRMPREVFASYQINVADDCSQFRALFSRGDLHVRIVHSGGPGEKPRELRWAKDPSQMKNETVCNLLAKFATGMSLLDHPYRFVAETGITDLLIALRNHQSIVIVLPQLVRGIRSGLYSFDVEKKKFCLKTLSRITSMQGIGAQLVPFYRQLLPPLRTVRQSRSRSDRVHYDKGRQIEEIITSTLNDLERTGGPNALINIKYLIPHYESCQYV
ncbi:Protein CBG23554 [Caenorhabditis briggsae]|uniref:Protein CBG23554 n=1 Tax=Caenorhabditis briggsae TaxID=6238 RepID=A8WIU0_CAEBR|nr:Protein CBG23554 [Caenorhabditis briggsae]CAP20383.1 Protein CBG23554 [Caenorhabditis briggsae]